jgi:hypothetical protein
MRTWILTIAVLMSSLMTWALPAQAQYSANYPYEYENVSLPGSYFSVEPYRTEQLQLQSWRYINRIVVQAEGHRKDGMIEVIANGVVKGTIYVPARDPYYTVTINETVNSLEFRHISGGRVTVISVTAEQSRSRFGQDQVCCRVPLSQARANLSTEIANQVIRLMEKLERFAKLDEQKTYLFPIKRQAGMLYAVAAARSDLSERTRDHVLALEKQIEFAHPFIQELFERAQTFDEAVELVNIKEKMRRLLE